VGQVLDLRPGAGCGLTVENHLCPRKWAGLGHLPIMASSALMGAPARRPALRAPACEAPSPDSGMYGCRRTAAATDGAAWRRVPTLRHCQPEATNGRPMVEAEGPALSDGALTVTGPWSTSWVRQEEYDQAVGMGQTNVDAIELMRSHCRHGRIELVGGNSFVGDALGLPMGLMEVRCEHAAPSGREAHQAMDLAIDFYNENCVGCPYRDGTGELPNLATVATQRVEEEREGRAEAERRAAERARRHDERERRRRDAVATESEVVRELAKQVDYLDRSEPRTGPMSAEE
jgi:hypothetical protein